MPTLEEMRAAHQAKSRYTVYLSPALKSPADRRSIKTQVVIESGLMWDAACKMADDLNHTMRKPGDFGGPVYGIRLEVGETKPSANDM